ncbi:hypothetical protein FVE85_1981 [Porphyridium purpureum]|uniref:Uncharacterized protein n=1 Tax=Porphyridium purpureum TaxID=35688 RepID=A0A5J4YWW4_PORPP|nr:hypothetical protein FVE85_1981 [Porphyridium purpureum]|eukprot:POR0853..scf209_3
MPWILRDRKRASTGFGTDAGGAGSSGGHARFSRALSARGGAPSRNVLIGIVLVFGVLLLLGSMSFSVERKMVLSVEIPDTVRNLTSEVITDAGIDKASSNLTLVVLLREDVDDALVAAIDSWHLNGLFDMVSQTVFLVENMRTTVTSFSRKLPEFIRAGVRVVSVSDPHMDAELIPWAVALSRSELVLIINKNFQLVEPPDVVKRHVEDGKRILLTNTAVAVKYKHRWKNTAPDLVRILYQDRERSLLQEMPDSACAMYTWNQALPPEYETYVHVCRNAFSDFYCSENQFCGWDSVPVMLRRSWFLDTFAAHVQQLQKLPAARDTFDSFVNNFVWRRIEPAVEVAFGNGLFKYVGSAPDAAVIESSVWRRYLASTDQYKRDLFDYEPQLRKEFDDDPNRKMELLPNPVLGGSATSGGFGPAGPPLPLRERVPASTRQLQNSMFERSLAWQQAQFQEIRAQVPGSLEYLAEHRVVYDLTTRALMEVAPQDPLSVNLTLVSAFFEFFADDSGGKPDSEQVKGLLTQFMHNVIALPYAKVIYCSATSEQMMREMAQSLGIATKTLDLAVFVNMELDELTSWIPNAPLLQQLREELSMAAPDKRATAEVAADRAHSRFAYQYARMYLLADEAQKMRQQDATSLLWIEPLAPCPDMATMDTGNDFILRIHTLNSFMFQVFDREHLDPELTAALPRLDGITKKVPASSSASDEGSDLSIVRGGSVFGGPIFHVRMVAWIYDSNFRHLLEDGILLPVDLLLTLTKLRAAELVHAFHESACASSPLRDHACRHAAASEHSAADTTPATPAGAPPLAGATSPCAVFHWIANRGLG